MSDIEKNNVSTKIEVVSDDVVSTYSSSEETPKLGKFASFWDGFKPHPLYNQKLDLEGLTDLEKGNVRSSAIPLKRSLKNRHLQMISIGGAIGTGLFVGSGKALARSGPAGLIIAWSLTGTMIYSVIQALGELTVAMPVSGSYLQYNSRFISPAWGFCMAWNYALSWLIVVPLELVAASITIKYWHSSVNPAAWVSIYLALVIFINIFGIRGYGEAEFIFACIKVSAILGFIILAIVLNCGGGPNSNGYIGGKYWHDPGAFSHGFKGVCAVFVTSAFSFSGSELAALAAAETENPMKALPKATKQVFWRITLFYIIALAMIGLLVPYNEPRLFGNSSADATASPFVIAIVNAGIKGLPSVMNVVIMIAVCSVANSGVFAASRTIVSLSDHGYAPRIFGYIDKKGRPLVGVGITLLFGFLCYLVDAGNQTVIFDWMLSLSGLSALFTWGSACACHLRFRRCLYVQGRDTGELEYVAQTGIWGSLYGIVLIGLIILSQFWVALWPLGADKPNVTNFFQTWLCVPLLIVFYIGYFVWKREVVFWIRSKDIDIDTGRRKIDRDLLIAQIAEEKQRIASLVWYKRVYHFWC